MAASKISKSTAATLATHVKQAQAYATLRGLTVTGTTPGEVAASLIGLADAAGTADALATEDAAYAAYLSAGIKAQDARANLAIAVVLLAGEGATAVAVAERFAIPGGSSAVPTWRTFGEWVLKASTLKAHDVTATGKRSEDRAEALRNGWNAVLAAKKVGGLKKGSAFLGKVAAGASADALRGAVPVKAQPASKPAGTPATPPVEPVEPSVPGADDVSLAADAVSLADAVAAGIERLAHMLTVDVDGTITPEQREAIHAVMGAAFTTWNVEILGESETDAADVA